MFPMSGSPQGLLPIPGQGGSPPEASGAAAGWYESKSRRVAVTLMWQPNWPWAPRRHVLGVSMRALPGGLCI